MKNSQQLNMNSVKSNKLTFNASKIVRVTSEEADLIAGGSTCANLTCTWCTSTNKSGK